MLCNKNCFFLSTLTYVDLFRPYMLQKWQIKYDTDYFQLTCTCTYCIKNNDIIHHAWTI